jgi:hypothetical protein
MEDDVLYSALLDDQKSSVSANMLRAGLAVYHAHDSRFDPDEIAVANIFIAMCQAMRQERRG